MQPVKFEIAESLWGSETPLDLIRFYGQFGSVGDLVHFSKSRPRAKMTVLERKPSPLDEPSITVVIPTANANGPHARRIAKYFDRFRIVLVESSGRYFNYSSSVNLGIKCALEHNPEWVIVSNDDMMPCSPITRLLESLKANNSADCLLASSPPRSRIYHSYDLEIIPSSLPFETVAALGASLSRFEFPPLSTAIPYILHRYGVQHRIRAHFSARHDDVPTTRGHLGGVFRSLGVRFREVPYKPLRTSAVFKNIGDFGVFGADTLSSDFFDEVFVNGMEDVDVSYRLWRGGKKIRLLDFEIGSIGEATISPTNRGLVLRWLRSVLNTAYFFSKAGLLQGRTRPPQS